MIEKMKKLSLLIYHGSRDKFFNGLQNFGVVHLEVSKSIVNDEIIALKDRLNRVSRAMRTLKLYEGSNTTKSDRSFTGTADQLIEKIETLNGTIEHINSEIDILQKEIAVLSSWGDFNPDNIKKLQDDGVFIKFFTISKSKFKKINLDNMIYEIISESKGSINFVVITKNEEIPADFPLTEERIPMKKLSDINKNISENLIEISSVTKEITELSLSKDILNSELSSVEDKLNFALAASSVSTEAEGKVLVINGWIPARSLEKVTMYLNGEDAAFIISEPSAEDNIPILLRNNPIAKLFEPITKIFSLPSYGELDTTPFFAPFFAAFFGLCLADMGYGLVVFISTLAALILIKNKSARPIILLGLVLGLSTAVGGYILDSFFGTNITKIAILPESFKRFVVFNSAEGVYGPMIFSLMLGILQISLGFILQSVNKFRSSGFFGLLQPIGNMLFLIGMVIWIFSGKFVSTLGGREVVVGPMHVGEWIYMLKPSPDIFGIATAITGILLILFFNSLDKPIFLRPLPGLWALYNAITGLLGNILSYVRLFALGLAGGLLGTSFNTIAFMTKDAPGGYIFMILIMVVGHTLNFGLGALGSFVHPLRLTFVEFYGSIDFKGGGVPFTPFKNRNK